VQLIYYFIFNTPTIAKPANSKIKQSVNDCNAEVNEKKNAYRMRPSLHTRAASETGRYNM